MMAVNLGPFQLEHPFILAPMSGITNSPFRRLMRSLGASMVISELVSANGLEYDSEKTQELLEFHEEERTVGLQIFGENTERLCKAARYVEKLGADFVDLNLGCPVPKVVKKGAGCSMCRDPIKLELVLRALVKTVKIPVTIKVRTGWDADSKNIHEIISAATDAGVAWVAIHGRTRAQRYSGVADWDLIGEAKVRSSIPIIGNGDLNTPEMAVQKYRTYGVDGVLIGRGALRNPFIFEQAAALWRNQEYCQPEPSRYLQLIDRQRNLLEETFAPRKAMLYGKKFLSWYSSGYSGSSAFRGAIFSKKQRSGFSENQIRTRIRKTGLFHLPPGE